MELDTRRSFLNVSALFEGGALGVGLLLGWATGGFGLASLRWDPDSLIWGALAALPVLLLASLAPDLRRLAREILGKPLAACAWYDLAALAILAGLGEEVLFRGALEAWLSEWNRWLGIVVTSLLFGLAHAVSFKYFLYTVAVGAYFSWLAYGWPGVPTPFPGPNVLRPVIAHAVYDFVAFLLIVRDYRRLQVES